VSERNEELRSCSCWVLPGCAGGSWERGADECAGTITAGEALRAEDARYQAQATNDIATLERLLGPDLVYIHSSAAMDSKKLVPRVAALRDRQIRAMRRSEVTCAPMVAGDDHGNALRCHTKGKTSRSNCDSIACGKASSRRPVCVLAIHSSPPTP